MPDYQQAEGTATSWRRASTVIINNPRNASPSIWFQEDDVVIVGEKEFISTGVSHVTSVFDSAAEIPLLNPDTGEALGTTATQADLQVILYSFYIQKATDRDNAALAAAASAAGVSSATEASTDSDSGAATASTEVVSDDSAADAVSA